MKGLFHTALLTGVSLMAAGTAQAQTAPTPTATAAKQADTTKAEDIVITGSRVIRNGANSPTPLTVMSADQFLKLSPTTLTDAVNLLPALQGSQSTTSKSGGGQRNGAAAYFDLRDMGDLRTLVLWDGHRVVPTINQNEADVDSGIVPQMLIKRVDVVTGGVSAVYGSDAISGVVNFVTDTSFEGIKLKATSGISTYGDDATSDYGIAFGKKLLDGKAHFEFSYEYHNDPGILNRYGRPFFDQSLGGGGLGTAAAPYYNVVNQRQSNSTFGGLITSGPFAGQMFVPGGTLAPFVAGTPTGVNNVQSGGDGSWYPNASLKAAEKSHQAFARFDYDVTDSIHFSTQAAYSAIHTYNNYQSPTLNLTINNCNAYLPAAFASTCAANPNGTFKLGEVIENTPRADQETEALMVYNTLAGDLGKWKWDVSFNYSHSQIRASNLANVNNANLSAATDAVNVGGQIQCYAATVNSAYANCVPINLFGGTPSAAALNYITEDTTNINKTGLEEITAHLTGSPGSTWAGPVQVALSAEGRRLTWQVDSNAWSGTEITSCAGLRYNCSTNPLSPTYAVEFNAMAGLPQVSQKVGELAAEIEVPLLRDASFAKSLDFNGAARYTNYSTSGGAFTYKTGLDWQVNDVLRLRGTFSHDIRAPNLFELYTPVQIQYLTFTDSISGKQGTVLQQNTGNPNLTPEKANTYTIGGVFKPGFIPHLSLSVDYFHIKVNDVIYQLDPKSATSQAACAASGGSSPICADYGALGYASLTSFPTELFDQYLNGAALTTKGIDFELNYNNHIAGHAFSLRALVSYQPKLEYNQGPAGIIELGGAAAGINLYASAPSVKVTGMASYDFTDNISLTVLERWRNAEKVNAVNYYYVDPNNSANVVQNLKDPALGYTTLTLAFHKDMDIGQFEAFFTVQNLFNAFPIVYYNGPVSSPGLGTQIPTGDDPVGRYFTVGLKLKL